MPKRRRLIELCDGVLLDRRREMIVAHGHLDRCMAEHFLDGLERDPAHRQVRREGVPQHVPPSETKTSALGAPDTEARLLFVSQLEAYGFAESDRALYTQEPGFLAPHLKPAFYRVSDLDTLKLSSFVGGALPPMVVTVSYELEINAEPLTPEDARQLLANLLTAARLS